MGIISIENLKNLADNGNNEAKYELGLRYYRGIGVPVDYEQARNYLEDAEKNGIGGASYYLGVIYYNGKGTPTNHAKAKEYFEKSEATNNVFSSYYLGKLYYWGDGVEKNLDKANEKIIFKLLKEMSNEGKCVIVVSHSDEVNLYSDICLELDNGKLKEVNHGK